MSCKKCLTEPVMELNNAKKLCKNCFFKYFEKKVFRTVSKYKLIDHEDKIVVGVSGGKDSLTTLYLLSKIQQKMREIKLEALLIDEGIKGYRDETIEDAKKFCKEHKIKLHIVSFKKEVGDTLDNLIPKLNEKACNICGTFRRYLLNKKARELKANKLATGHNLDDESQSIIMNTFRNQVFVNARLGPITGILKDKNFIPRIKPLYFLTEKEVMTYSFLKGFSLKFNECPNAKDSYRGDVRDVINNFEGKYNGTKNGIINSFMEMLPLLKKKYKNYEMSFCKECNEPSSKEVCHACSLINKIKK